MSSPGTPARRADAQRNYCSLVVAAREVFGERGIDAPLDEIAHRAGIGNATLYRHFPGRGELVAAVFTDQLQEYAEAARLAAAADDPWQGFRDYLTTVCEIQARNRGLADLLTTVDVADARIEELRSAGRRSLIRIIRRAQRAGRLRPDFTPQDVVIVLMANAGLVARTVDRAPGSSARLVALILDGLAADAATPAPPAPRERDLLAAMGDCG